MAVVVVLLVSVAGPGWAQQPEVSDAPRLERLVREAMARDPALEQRRLQVRDRQVGLAMAAAGRGFVLALRLSDPGDGQWLVGVTDADFGFGVAANVTANLPHPLGTVSTKATMTGPVGEEPAEGMAWELGPVAVKLSSGVEQPVGSLIGLDATDADDLEAAHEVVQAERAVRGRARAIAGEVLGRIVAIIQGEKAERRAIHDLRELEAEVVRRREVFEENENSHSFQSLLFAVEQERRGLDTTRLRLREERAALERHTGFSRFGVLAEAPLLPPLDSDVERAPEVVDATVELRASELRIREDANAQWPEVTLGAGYDWNTGSLSAGIGFNLTVPIVDGGLRNLQRERHTNYRTAAQLAGTVARRDYAEAVIQAERDIRDLEYATWELRERTRLAALRVEETRRALAAGVVTEEDVAQAELDHDLLAYDAQILRANRWKLALDLSAFTDVDPLEMLAAAR